MNKIKKAAVAACVASGAYLAYKAADEIVARLLISDALDREEPRVMKKFKNAVKGDMRPDPLGERMREESERLGALELETVRIKAADGTPLVAKYRPAPDAKRLIVAMHGWRTNWTRDFGALADFWYENDCSVLYPSQRGQGESGGDYMSFGAFEGSDCARWADWLAERAGVDLPMYLCGVSMGATTVMMASALTLPENVRGIVADCGFTCAKDIWKHVVEKNLRISYAKREKRVNALCRRRLGCDADKHSTLDALAANKIPILFIHGASDTFVPIEMTYRNYLACRAPRRLLVVPGASHARSSWVDPTAYRDALERFWSDLETPSENRP